MNLRRIILLNGEYPKERSEVTFGKKKSDIAKVLSLHPQLSSITFAGWNSKNIYSVFNTGEFPLQNFRVEII
ncbi:MAG: hypothetical protein EZS28_002807 [Streblomastix strix]|uniref:Uncharacterized protein n=1 Tax=Streblomastix strix TaxID=222440 RepID=A0A5J4X3W0_9EUKA|nr:MAG: hypothetical protein EZS28_002807 [Streblomastix strix]